MKMNKLLGILVFILLLVPIVCYAAPGNNVTIIVPENNTIVVEEQNNYFEWNCSPTSALSVFNTSWYLKTDTTIGFELMQTGGNSTPWNHVNGTTITFNDTSFIVANYTDLNPIQAYATCILNQSATFYTINSEYYTFPYTDYQYANVIDYPVLNNSNFTEASSYSFAWNCTPKSQWQVLNSSWFLQSNSSKGYEVQQANGTQVVNANTTIRFNDTAWIPPAYIDMDPILGYTMCVYNHSNTIYRLNSSVMSFNINYKPIITSTTISPNPPLNTSVMTCTVVATDDDGDSLEYWYSIYADGEINISYESSSLTSKTYNLSSSLYNFTVGQKLICEVMAQDNASNAPVNSTKYNSSANLIYSCGDGVKTIDGDINVVQESCTVCIDDFDSLINLSTGYNLYPTGYNMNYTDILTNLVTGLSTYDSLSFYNFTSQLYMFDYLVGWDERYGNFVVPDGEPVVLYSLSSTPVECSICLDYSIKKNITKNVPNSSNFWAINYNNTDIYRNVTGNGLGENASNTTGIFMKDLLTLKFSSNVSSISWFNESSQTWIDYFPSTSKANENFTVPYLDSIYSVTNSTLYYEWLFDTTGGLII